MALWGRTEEQAVLDGLLAKAAAGHSAVLVVRGEPGIGKTALLRYAEERARCTHRMAVERTIGVETEAEIPFASLHLLLQPALGRIDALPQPQAAALKAAFGLATGGGDDQLPVGLAVLSLLSEMAADAPLLCLVDDAHWLDHASARALLFAARRLRAENIALVFGARDGFDAGGLPELGLAGLDPASSTQLLAERSPELDLPLRRRMVEESAGNPLALMELPHPADAHGRAPLPLPHRIQQAYGARMAALPSTTRTALLVAAAEDTGDLDAILRAVADLGAGPDALDAAEAAGLVHVRTGRVSFVHPLMRSAALRAASRPSRLAAHRALAEVSRDQPDRRAWHLAAGARGHDEEAALALEEAAQRAQDRHGHAGTATALERAAELTSDPAARSRRLVAAAHAAAYAGLAERAKTLIETATRTTSEPLTRARLQALRARLAFDEGDPATAHALLLGAAEQITGAGDKAAERVEAGLMLVDAARNAWQLSNPVRLREAADRLDALHLRPEDGLDAAVDAVTGAAVFLERGPAQALATMRTLVADGRRKRSGAPALRINAAFVAGLVGDFDTGREISAAVAADCRTRGDIGWLPLAHLTLAACELYLGRFRDAEASATEGLQLAADTGQPNRAGYLQGMLAWIWAIRGDQARSVELAARCHDHFDATGIVNSLAWAEWALALGDLGQGRFAQVWERLEAAQAGPVGRQIQSVYFAPDRVEASARLALPAHAPLEQFAQWADASRLAWADAVLHRCRALLEPDWDTAHQLFTKAVRLHAESGRPWEAARTRLLFGERLRRERHRTDARSHLRAALDTFERLGALPWAERARAELRAAGASGPLEARDNELVARLSPQELQIVRLAATGMTNREIGAQLFLSPKTISYHLYRAFPKLQVGSRAQLAGLDLTG
ncbi:ATP-binding protein [Streptomyces sp. NPDC005930]|uniref:ATP-binding protein n=1 Tax=Streptomyces sp. NPDC005930 TaxID=3364736 RepID=UPI0036C4D587